MYSTTSTKEISKIQIEKEKKVKEDHDINENMNAMASIKTPPPANSKIRFDHNYWLLSASVGFLVFAAVLYSMGL